MKPRCIASLVTASASILIVGMTLAAQDKYSVQVPGGLALSEFRGYEDWQTVSVSQAEGRLKLILANAVMIDAYRAGVPGNGKPFPDGAKMAKVEWEQRINAEAPAETAVPDTLAGLGFMVKDSRRFADSGGWGYAQFSHDPTSDSYVPDENYVGDAACGHACHTAVAAKDYVFTAYAKR